MKEKQMKFSETMYLERVTAIMKATIEADKREIAERIFNRIYIKALFTSIRSKDIEKYTKVVKTMHEIAQDTYDNKTYIHMRDKYIRSMYEAYQSIVIMEDDIDIDGAREYACIMLEYLFYVVEQSIAEAGIEKTLDICKMLGEIYFSYSDGKALIYKEEILKQLVKVISKIIYVQDREKNVEIGTIDQITAAITANHRILRNAPTVDTALRIVDENENHWVWEIEDGFELFPKRYGPITTGSKVDYLLIAVEEVIHCGLLQRDRVEGVYENLVGRKTQERVQGIYERLKNKMKNVEGKKKDLNQMVNRLQNNIERHKRKLSMQIAIEEETVNKRIKEMILSRIEKYGEYKIERHLSGVEQKFEYRQMLAKSLFQQNELKFSYLGFFEGLAEIIENRIYNAAIRVLQNIGEKLTEDRVDQYPDYMYIGYATESIEKRIKEVSPRSRIYPVEKKSEEYIALLPEGASIYVDPKGIEVQIQTVNADQAREAIARNRGMYQIYGAIDIDKEKNIEELVRLLIIRISIMLPDKQYYFYH